MLQQIFTESLTHDSGVAEHLCDVRLEQDDVRPLPCTFEILASDTAGKIGLGDVVFFELVVPIAHIVAALVRLPRGR